MSPLDGAFKAFPSLNYHRISVQTQISRYLKEKEGKKQKSEMVVYCFLCSLRTVIGDVLVSAMPGMARKTSPMK